MKIRERAGALGTPRYVFRWIASSLLLASASCSGNSTGTNFGQLGDAGGAASSSSGAASNGSNANGGGTLLLGGQGGAAGGSSTGCSGLACQQKACAAGGSTTLSGRVFDPSGQLPLYNVMVYVPNAELTPLSQGAGCTCEVSGSPIASALTDTNGHFVMQNVPVGSNIPVVVQVGKWRRKFNVPSVAECTDTAVPDGTFLLPGKQSEGDLPKIALSTGNADALECLLPKLGIDTSEFTNPDGAGRINYFAGHGGANRYAPSMNGGASMPAASALWSTLDALRAYDLVLLSCEGGMYPDEKGAQAFQAMFDYANLGGRIFASHWHEAWFIHGPSPFPNVATFVDQADLGNITANVVTSFPKGQALADWLVNVKASQTAGSVNISAAQHTVQTENPTYAQRWIANDSKQSVQYLSANTPLGAPAAMQCGRAVLSDIHVSNGGGKNSDSSSPDTPYPQGCVTTGLSAQEKVLAFMLFDISACLVPDDSVPMPPPVVR